MYLRRRHGFQSKQRIKAGLYTCAILTTASSWEPMPPVPSGCKPGGQPPVTRPAGHESFAISAPCGPRRGPPCLTLCMRPLPVRAPSNPRPPHKQVVQRSRVIGKPRLGNERWLIKMVMAGLQVQTIPNSIDKSGGHDLKVK